MATYLPLWKRLLSYLFEMHIESAPSELNPHLYVSVNKGRYQLSTANAVYSFEDLYDNFTKTFQKMDLKKSNIEKVLVLGFGLGSVPLMLEKKFHQNYHYTGVELDENVIYLADKYGVSDLKSPLELICADAYIFAMTCLDKFDLIAMDVFMDDVIPTHFEAIEFLKKLRDLLTPQGYLLYNRLALTEKDLNKTRQFFEHNFKTVFPEGTYLDVGGNWMLINRSIT